MYNVYLTSKEVSILCFKTDSKNAAISYALQLNGAIFEEHFVDVYDDDTIFLFLSPENNGDK